MAALRSGSRVLDWHRYLPPTKSALRHRCRGLLPLPTMSSASQVLISGLFSRLRWPAALYLLGPFSELPLEVCSKGPPSGSSFPGGGRSHKKQHTHTLFHVPIFRRTHTYTLTCPHISTHTHIHAHACSRTHWLAHTLACPHRSMRPLLYLGGQGRGNGLTL